VTQKPKNFFNRKDLFAYFLVAGFGAIIQLVCQSLLQDWFKISYAWSIQIAYQISLVVGFILTKMFAFDVRNTEKTKREMVKFIVVSQFSGLIMTFAALSALAFFDYIHPEKHIFLPHSNKDVHLNQLLSTIVGMGFSFISNYFLHKKFTFKSTGFYDRLKAVLK
jgi:putative flippase GtrA